MGIDAERSIPVLPDESEYPAELLARCELLERLSGGQDKETLLARERESGALFTVKCFYSGGPLFDREEPEALKTLNAPPMPRFVAEYRNELMRCVLREYVAGRTLAEAAAERAWSEEEIRGLGLQLCEQLAVLQSLDPPIVHRDVKPQNVILRSDGSAVLIDFDIARAQTGRSTDTMVLGTEGFAPPEQFGYARTDERSDVYALGALLHWLRTGGTEPPGPAGTPLERVIRRCTAFDPKDRYADALALRRALERTDPRRQRRWWPALLPAAAVLIAVLCLLLPRAPAAPEASGAVEGETAVPSAALPFAEPLLEQAVRQQLGLTAGETLTPEELASVTELYLLGDRILPDADEFYTAVNQWYADGKPGHGTLHSLEDLRQMPNLRVFCAAAEELEDLSPLAALERLEKLELKHNRIADLTPISGLKHLVTIGVNDNPVQDLSPLSGCPELAFLDLCDARAYDPAALAELGDRFEYLDLSNPTESWRFLDGKQITRLRLAWSGLEDLSVLEGVTGLEELDLSHCRVTDLTPLRSHPGLKRLNLAYAPLQDLNILAELPALEQVTLSRSQSPLLEVLGETKFTVDFA